MQIVGMTRYFEFISRYSVVGVVTCLFIKKMISDLDLFIIVYILCSLVRNFLYFNPRVVAS